MKRLFLLALLLPIILVWPASAAYLGSWKIDDNLTFVANTHDPDTGVATDADSVPSYRVYEDETGTAILTGSMAKLDDDNTTGFYSEQIALSAANGLEKGKSYSIYISATVDSDTGTMSHNFQMEAEVDAQTVSATNVSANIAQISDDATAAANLELAFDTTGYGFTNCTMPTVTTVVNDVNTTVTGTVDANVVTVLGDAPIDTADILDQAKAAIQYYNLDHIAHTACTSNTFTNDVNDYTMLAFMLTKTDGDISDYNDLTMSLEGLYDATQAVNVASMDANTITSGVMDANTITDTTFTADALTAISATDANDVADVVLRELISDHQAIDGSLAYYIKQTYQTIPFE